MHRLRWMLTAVVAWLCASAPASTEAQTAAGRWSDVPALRLARQEVGAARIGTDLYVVGGLVGTSCCNATNSVEILDLETLQWRDGVALPVGLDHMGVAAIENTLYVVGGYAADFQPRDELWMFDRARGDWQRGPRMPEARGACWAVAFAGKLYVFGGLSFFLGGAPTSVLIYDPASNQWSVGSSMSATREHLAAVAAGDYIYVIGGRFNGSTGRVERYHPASDTWDTMTPMPTARAAPGAATLGERIYVAGGETNTIIAAVEVYDIARDTWSRLAPMPNPRHGVAAIAYQDRIFFPAGGTIAGLRPTSAADVFTPAPVATSRPAWGALKNLYRAPARGEKP